MQELRAAARKVYATDLVDYGCPGSESRVDFLMELRAPPGAEPIVTNLRSSSPIRWSSTH